jgi:aromatic ring-opening dioxygenase catalytic subunit (LigB family)
MFRGIIDICSEYDTEYMNIFFGQKIETFCEQVVHTVTTMLESVNRNSEEINTPTHNLCKHDNSTEHVLGLYYVSFCWCSDWSTRKTSDYYRNNLLNTISCKFGVYTARRLHRRAETCSSSER